MATHSSTLALKIPWMEELGAGYYSWGGKESARLRDFTFTFFLIMSTLLSQLWCSIHSVIFYSLLFCFVLFKPLKNSEFIILCSVILFPYIFFQI